MMALDYARSPDVAELIYAYMQGNMLPDQAMMDRVKQARAASAKFAGCVGAEEGGCPRHSLPFRFTDCF